MMCFLTGMLHWFHQKGGDDVLLDITGGTSIVVVLTLCVLTILVLGIFNLFQLARVREMRDDIRELRYYIVQLSRRANVNLEEVTPPERKRMPVVDRGGYWQREQDSAYTFPSRYPDGRWPRPR